MNEWRRIESDYASERGKCGTTSLDSFVMNLYVYNVQFGVKKSEFYVGID